MFHLHSNHLFIAHEFYLYVIVWYWLTLLSHVTISFHGNGASYTCILSFKHITVYQ